MMGNERSLLIIFYSIVFSFLGLDTKFYAPCAAQLLSSLLFSVIRMIPFCLSL